MFLVSAIMKPMIEVAKLAIIEPDDKYLLLYRDNHPVFGTDPDVPGGIVEDGETLLEAMQREVREETGIEISTKKVDMLFLGNHRSTHNTYSYTLFVTKLKVRPEVVISWEHASYEWISRDEFLAKAKGANDTYMNMVSDTLALKH